MHPETNAEAHPDTPGNATVDGRVKPVRRLPTIGQHPPDAVRVGPASGSAPALEAAAVAGRAPSGFLCRSPFEYVHIQANGDVYPCCPSKFGQVIGNLTTQTLDEVWNSEEAAQVRASMVNGSYRFCNASACEYLRGAHEQGEALAPPELVTWCRDRGLLDAASSPRVANFGSDRSCNLSCGYCRRSVFRPTLEDDHRVAAIDRNFFTSTLADTQRIVLLGEGDPFASKFYRDKLMRYDWSRHPGLKIKIQTNGLLLTRAMWQSIERAHVAIDWIWVSIDAASPETYRENRGGDFEHLLRNLDFIANLRALQHIDRFCLSFVAQANNFQEMPAFVRLGKSLGCDLVEFQRIENWGTFSHDEYLARAVHEPQHPNHAEFGHVLNQDELHDPIVWSLKVTARPHRASPIGVMSWDDCASEEAS